MSSPLDGIDLKLGQADQYFDLLDAERTKFLNSGGNRVVGDFEPGTTDYVFRIVGKPPPVECGIYLSGFAHFVRTALENGFIELVRARGTKPTRDHGFPICEHRNQFIRPTKRPGNPPVAEVMTRGVTTDDFAFIEAVQPYKAGDGARWHPLALLAYLNNVDKHRYIHIARVGSAGRIPHPRLAMAPYLLGDKRPVPTDSGGRVLLFGMFRGFRSPNESVDLGQFPKQRYGPGREEDSTEVARLFGLTVVGPDPKVEMEPPPTIEIAFSDRKRMVHIADLSDIRIQVKQIIEYFRPIIG